MDRTISPASVWQHHAKQTVRRLNFAWWLQFFAPWAAGLGMLIMVLVLWQRSQGTVLPRLSLPVSIAGIYAITGLACWWRVRRRFAKPTDGMVLLESRLKLNNALTAASGGITAWPTAPAKVDDGFRFRAPWLVAPALLTASCLLVAFLLPVQKTSATPALPPPMALARAEAILNALQKENVADPAALEKAREQLQTLLDQPPESYYTHHNLEAADALETSLGEAAGNLGSHLQSAAQSAESLEKFDSSLSPSARQQLESDLQSAIEGIKNSSLGASAALQNQLGQLDPSKLKNLDPEQLRKMMENLKAKAKACKDCKGGNCQGKSEAEQALEDLLNGKNGEGNGKDGMGQGDVNRGPGTGDLTFEKNASELETNKLEMLESQDLSRTLPGDHLGTKDIEHRLDKTSPGVSAGGAVTAPALGGDAVWKDQLLPSEQKVLRRYFK